MSLIYLRTTSGEITVHEDDIRLIDGRIVTLRSGEQHTLQEGDAVAHVHRQLHRARLDRAGQQA